VCKRGNGVCAYMASERSRRDLCISLIPTYNDATDPPFPPPSEHTQAYHQCLQGWAPTLLHQLPSPASIPLLPSLLEWAEAALLSLPLALPMSNNRSNSNSNSNSTHEAVVSGLLAATWEVYATVARRCAEALLAWKPGLMTGGDGGGSSSSGGGGGGGGGVVAGGGMGRDGWGEARGA
jgi:uncharacterized membrane protein YgcG